MKGRLSVKCKFLTMRRVGSPNPHVVQGSTVDKCKDAIKGGEDQRQEDELGSGCNYPCEGIGLGNGPSYVTEEEGCIHKIFNGKNWQILVSKRVWVAEISN